MRRGEDKSCRCTHLKLQRAHCVREALVAALADGPLCTRLVDLTENRRVCEALEGVTERVVILLPYSGEGQEEEGTAEV